jgi:hypothetical protein
MHGRSIADRISSRFMRIRTAEVVGEESLLAPHPWTRQVERPAEEVKRSMEICRRWSQAHSLHHMYISLKRTTPMLSSWCGLRRLPFSSNCGSCVVVSCLPSTCCASCFVSQRPSYSILHEETVNPRNNIVGIVRMLDNRFVNKKLS